jgi:hypothetical protein
MVRARLWIVCWNVACKSSYSLAFSMAAAARDAMMLSSLR